MIKNHKINADEFLDFVHDIDVDFLKKDFNLCATTWKSLMEKKLFLLMGLGNTQ